MQPVDRRAVLAAIAAGALSPLRLAAAQAEQFGWQQKHEYAVNYLARKFPNIVSLTNAERVVGFVDDRVTIPHDSEANYSAMWKKGAEVAANWIFDPKNERGWEFAKKFRQVHLTDRIPDDPVDRANFEKYGWYIPEEQRARQKGDNNDLFIYSESTAEQIGQVMRYSLDQAGLPLKHINDTLNKKFPGSSKDENMARTDEVAKVMNDRVSSLVPPEQGKEAMKKFAEAWIGWRYGSGNDAKKSCLLSDTGSVKFTNQLPAELTPADFATFNRQGWVIPQKDWGASDSKTLYMRPDLTTSQISDAMKARANAYTVSAGFAKEVVRDLDGRKDCTDYPKPKP